MRKKHDSIYFVSCLWVLLLYNNHVFKADDFRISLNFLLQGSGSPMHIDSGLQSPGGKRECAAGDGIPPSLQPVKEEPMQLGDKAKSVIIPIAKVTEKVVSY